MRPTRSRLSKANLSKLVVLNCNDKLPYNCRRIVLTRMWFFVFHELGLVMSYVTAVDCILHCSDMNVFLFSTTSIAGAQARPSQYLCNMITFKSRE